MNCARVADLLRQLADEIDPASSGKQTPVDAPKPKKPRALRIVRPAGESDELTARAAEKVLRKHGFTPRGPQ